MKNKPIMLIAYSAMANLKSLKSVLSDQFDILESSDGAGTIELIKNNPAIDVIVLDVFISNINGFDVLRFIKNDRSLMHIPVVVNSCNPEHEKASYELGASEFILTPYNPQFAKSRIMRALSNAAIERTYLEHQFQNASQSFSALSNAIPGGIAMFEITDDDIRIVFYNDAFCALSGRTTDEFSRDISGDFSRVVDPKDRARLIYTIRTSATEGGGFIRTVFRYIHKSGQIRWVKISASRFRNEKTYSLYIAVFIDITDEKEYEKKLKHQAEFDMLTDIYNRTAFCEKTNILIHDNTDRQFCIVFCDVDKFKVINDLFGNSTGDMVLVNIAKVLRRYVGGIGTFGRLEADHFAMCVPQDHLDEADVSKYVSKCTEGLQITYNITLSFGIYQIEDPDVPVEKMCDRASLAVHSIKNNCIKKYEYYDKKLRQAILDEQQIAAEMVGALEKNQFVVYYQPVVSSFTQKITAAEALLRWQHPQKGIMSPGTFIPAFEKNGFVTKVDRFVWESVCIFLKKRKLAGEKMVPVSVNMSRVNIFNPDLCNIIINLIKKYDIEPRLIRFEITESVFTDNQDQLLNTVTTLRKHGFLIMMDDFGSGYSSLNSLKDIPVDIIKIDRNFIIDIDTSQRGLSVLKSVVYLARELDIPLVAEGIETKSQFEQIKNLGCDNIQGFYFSKPLCEDKFDRYIDEHI